MAQAEEETPKTAADIETAGSAVQPARVVMHPGFEISGEAVAEITRENPSRIIVVAGPTASGKTSLLTAIYDLFGLGRFDSLVFAGSKTLGGFERRCHTMRIASERSLAEAERTKLESDFKLLHLRVRHRAAPTFTDALITDISGEKFRQAKDSTAECKKMALLRRADVFAICLDGEKLSKRATKAATIWDGKALLRSVLDAGMLPNPCVVQVVITKEDLMTVVDDETRDELTDRIRQEFSHFAARVEKLEFRSTSVKPLASATGVMQLFTSWVEPLPMPLPSSPTAIADGRQYDRFKAS